MIKQNPVGMAALAIGILAILLGVVVPELLPVPEPPPNTNLVTKIKGLLGSKPTTDEQRKFQDTVRRYKTAKRALTIGGLVGGAVAAILGLIAWIKHEHRRLALGAIALGAVAALWQWILVAIAVGVIFTLVASFS